jgi:hypothetical protein
MSHAVQALHYELCSTSHAVQALHYEVCSTSHAVQALHYELCSTSRAVPVMQYKPCSMHAAQYCQPFMLRNSSHITLYVNTAPALPGRQCLHCCQCIHTTPSLWHWPRQLVVVQLQLLQPNRSTAQHMALSQLLAPQNGRCLSNIKCTGWQQYRPAHGIEPTLGSPKWAMPKQHQVYWLTAVQTSTWH